MIARLPPRNRASLVNVLDEHPAVQPKQCIINLKHLTNLKILVDFWLDIKFSSPNFLSGTVCRRADPLARGRAPATARSSRAMHVKPTGVKKGVVLIYMDMTMAMA